ncbi:hypothetical protein BJ912DRAFT_1062834 [Pholiota molesta]|nr:hypothetical protein BJ912DRAFT_1062834 [Pholiota molesta]
MPARNIEEHGSRIKQGRPGQREIRHLPPTLHCEPSAITPAVDRLRREHDRSHECHVASMASTVPISLTQRRPRLPLAVCPSPPTRNDGQHNDKLRARRATDDEPHHMLARRPMA